MAKFDWSKFIADFGGSFPNIAAKLPWMVVEDMPVFLKGRLKDLGSDYKVTKDVAIHKKAVIEENAIIKGPVIIGPQCFIASHVYLRGGVLLVGRNSLGPGCEVKSSLILEGSNLAHFNFIGDSIIGADVNFEAGAVVANHYNERTDKAISVRMGGEMVSIGIEKFGALVGDRCKIGANAVLSPGTMLQHGQIVARLALVDQSK